MKDLNTQTILIVGLGLIGGSLARGIKKQHSNARILAHDADQENLGAALDKAIIDDDRSELSEKVRKADLVIVATPTLSVPEIFETIAPELGEKSVVTDVASVKGTIVEGAKSALGHHAQRFVPGHPIAGSEQSGFLAANADLFRDHKVILTPSPDTDAAAVNLVHSLWRSLGAQVIGMSVSRHDQVLAATSHLPHLLSYGLVALLLKSNHSEDIFRYAAGGFTDFSRLASSDPTMWADIFSANAPAISSMLDEFEATLQVLRTAISRGDHQTMKEMLTESKNARDRFVEHLAIPGSKHLAQEERQVNYTVAPGGRIEGDCRVPGDKSVSHRAIILGALADGVTEVEGFLEGEDALNTLEAFREMGVTIVGPEGGRLTIYGVGLRGLSKPQKPLYMGNSGTAMRLLAGLLAAQDFSSELTGDESLSKRPMERVAAPLRTMGAVIETSHDGTPPLRIEGSSLHGIDYTLPVASAQVKSALLLAALFADGETRVTEPAICRDHTERMLKGFGYNLDVDSSTGKISIEGNKRLQATRIDVPGDISSAAFFIVAAAIAPGSRLTIRHVGMNPTRTGVIDILRLMGADIEMINEKYSGGEPVADLIITHSELKGVDIPERLVPLAIDEFPIIFIAAACAEGTTRLRGADELRVKESDRLQSMANGLEALGVSCTLYADGIDIVGGGLTEGEVDSHGDHRIAMAFSVAALRAEGSVSVKDCANVATSFPGFAELARSLGLKLALRG